MGQHARVARRLTATVALVCSWAQAGVLQASEPEVQMLAAPAVRLCALKEVDALILDLYGDSASLAFGETWSWVEKQVSQNGRAPFSASTQAIQTALKALALGVLAKNTRVDFELPDGDTVTRPRRAGALSVQSRYANAIELRARVTVDSKGMQLLNCLRPALNAFGIDADMPQAGALAGVAAHWRITVGGPEDFGLLPPLTTREQIAYLRESGLVWLIAPGGPNQTTDSSGKTSIGLAGAAQKHDLTRMCVYRDATKEAEVKLLYTVKGLDLTVAEISSILSTAVAGFRGDIVSLGWGLVVDPLSRAIRKESQPLKIKVVDWELCRWKAEVTVAHVTSERVSNLGAVFTYAEEYSWDINGSEPESRERAGELSSQFAVRQSATAAAVPQEIFVSSIKSDECTATIISKSDSGQRTEASDATLQLEFDPDRDQYHLNIVGLARIAPQPTWSSVVRYSGGRRCAGERPLKPWPGRSVPPTSASSAVPVTGELPIETNELVGEHKIDETLQVGAAGAGRGQTTVKWRLTPLGTPEPKR